LDAETAIQVFFVFTKCKAVPSKRIIAWAVKATGRSDSFDGFLKRLLR
jgi:hypothetical protein